MPARGKRRSIRARSSGQVEKMLFPGVLRRQSIFAVPAGITENDCASDLWL
jgi:hypothetical protein